MASALFRDVKSVLREVPLARLAIGLALAAATASLGLWWWNGRPSRHLAFAEQALVEEGPRTALEWLALPEATAATREQALLLRARIAVERGDPARAARVLDQIDPSAPNAAAFAYWKGRTLLAARQPLLAQTWLNKALGHDPTHADAARWLAVAAYDLGDRSTAVDALKTVARLDPADSKPWRTLGLIYKEYLEYELAADALEHCLTLAGAADLARLELAEVRLRLGDATSARVLLRDCEGRVPRSRRAAALAECQFLQGELEPMRQTLEAGLAADPENLDLLVQTARLDAAEGRRQAALRRLDRVLELNPYHAESLYQRALILRGLGRDRESRVDLDRSEALKLGLARMSSLNDQAASNPQDPEVRYQLGKLCVDLGKPELAASWYRAALACDPGHRGSRLELEALSSSSRAKRSSP